MPHWITLKITLLGLKNSLVIRNLGHVSYALSLFEVLNLNLVVLYLIYCYLNF